jgi:hypothetical protein
MHKERNLQQAKAARSRYGYVGAMGLDFARRLECGCFSAALVWDCTEYGHREAAVNRAHSRRFATSLPRAPRLPASTCLRSGTHKDHRRDLASGLRVA